MSKNYSGEGCFVLLLIFGAISLVLQAIGVVLKITIIAALVIFGLVIAYKIIRAIYHLFNPEAKKAFIERKATEAEEWKKRKLQEDAEDRAKRERRSGSKTKRNCAPTASRWRPAEFTLYISNWKAW